MPKKLYVVDVEIETFQVCVLAEDRNNAERIALENAEGEFRNIDSRWIASGGREVKIDADLPDEWKNAMPYTDDDEQDDCSTYVSAEVVP